MQKDTSRRPFLERGRITSYGRKADIPDELCCRFATVDSSAVVQTAQRSRMSEKKRDEDEQLHALSRNDHLPLFRSGTVEFVSESQSQQ